MPSFDIVSEVDHHELANAVDQANREVATRFDFKGSGASFTLADNTITLTGQTDYQLRQMCDMLYQKLAGRGIELGSVEAGEPEIHAQTARQTLTVREGIDAALAKQIVRQVKGSKLKVQAAVQGDQVRVTGKKRDDLQSVISLVKGAGYELPLQFQNFRD